MTPTETSPISSSEEALHQELLKQLHLDLERARALNAGRSKYLTKREYRELGEIELYRRLFDQLSAVGGHNRVASFLGMQVSKGGAGSHRS